MSSDRLALAAASLAALVACMPDPSRDVVVEELGPEAPRVPKGPLHRPGQPCLACHRPQGKAPEFSVAGTIYQDRQSLKPLSGVSVVLTDVAGRTYRATSNCAGNFYVAPGRYTPSYPMWVSLRLGDLSADMESPSNREGSCATCHSDPAGPASAGAVYLLEDPAMAVSLPASRCPEDN